MYFTALPDHSEPGFDEKLHFGKFNKHNIIFNALSSKSYCERHVGSFSIKTVLSGEEWYGIDNRQIAVRPGQFLILNDDQEYSCRIDSPVQVNTLSICFKKEFAYSVFRDVSCTEEKVLDIPHDSEGHFHEFYQTLYTTGSTIKQKLLNLVAALNEYGYHKDMVDEHLVFLLYDLVHVHKIVSNQAKRVCAVKPTTRKEIYKRLCMAKDLLHSTFMHKPDLAAMSKTACLSVPQLIRQFKAVFQTTPHQYLNKVRLAHAKELLKVSDLQLSEITIGCGFENTSAFCRSFKKEFGVTPLYFRSAC